MEPSRCGFWIDKISVSWPKGRFGSVDQAADLVAQQQIGAGAGRIVLHLEPAGLVYQERHAGSLGFDDAANRGVEDLAGVVAIEAAEAIEDAGDEELERDRRTTGKEVAGLQEPRRAQQPDLHRQGREEGLEAEPERVRCQGRAELRQVGAAEWLATAVRTYSGDSLDLPGSPLPRPSRKARKILARIQG